MEMSTLQLQPPELFDFKSPDSWPKWKRRFKQYRDASGLSGESEPRQVSTLLYCLGEEANDVLASTNITEEEKKVFLTVMEKLDGFFKVRHNVIFERARFNMRNQLPGEAAEKYIAELYRLADNCNFGNFRDELIRDRLVVGILDQKTSQQLQMDPALTVEKAKKTICQREAVQEQSQELGCEKRRSESLGELEKTIAELQTSMNELKKKPYSNNQRGCGPPRFTRQGGANINNTAAAGTCSKCGYEQHQRGGRCPANEATCHRCNRKGHFSSRCFSRIPGPAPIAEIDSTLPEAAFLDAVNDGTSSSWMVTVTMGNQLIEFKMDTGAGVTAITEETYAILQRPQLIPAPKALCGPTRQNLDVLGFYETCLSHRDRSAPVGLYVVKGLKTNPWDFPQ